MRDRLVVKRRRRARALDEHTSEVRPLQWSQGIPPDRNDVASITEFSIVTFERKPGLWRAAITPIRPAGIVIRGRTVTSIVTPGDYSSEPDAEFAAHKMILKL